MLGKPVFLLSFVLSLVAGFAPRLEAATTGPFSLGSGSSFGVSGNGTTDTNVQVSTTSGTVTVTVTYPDGTTKTGTASPGSPFNYTRWDNEHNAYLIKDITITATGGAAKGKYLLQ